MIPVVSILSAGILVSRAAYAKAPPIWIKLVVAFLILTWAITYSSLFDSNNKNTWEEDYALLANASLRTLRDADAIQYAEGALKMNPNRADMYAVLAQAHFNLWAFAEKPTQLDQSTTLSLLKITELGASQEPGLRALTGIYLWKLRQQDSAIAVWEELRESDALAQVCLIWIGHQTTEDISATANYQKHPLAPMLYTLANQGKAGIHPNEARFMESLLQPVSPASTEPL